MLMFSDHRSHTQKHKTGARLELGADSVADAMASDLVPRLWVACNHDQDFPDCVGLWYCSSHQVLEKMPFPIRHEP